ncbi:hypothetical protein EVAR_102941_1 [Eumeta japonica]|uniref:Frizzled/Smoothened 7TM domain-containing protein n=1 Tax=Eumeta variegata TaxID=151549 RepID=A0A4C1UPH5_EUMVA|nr:hypothetical protein EVAR_102941_1 [Eumeta japonica]
MVRDYGSELARHHDFSDNYYGRLALPLIRWVVVVGAWRATVLRPIGTNTGGRTPHSSLLQLAAWGVPAALTAAVLVTRDVDADELTAERVDALSLVKDGLSARTVYANFFKTLWASRYSDTTMQLLSFGFQAIL